MCHPRCDVLPYSFIFHGCECTAKTFLLQCPDGGARFSATPRVPAIGTALWLRARPQVGACVIVGCYAGAVVAGLSGGRLIPAALGTMPTTRAQCLIPSFTRSSRLVLQSWRQWLTGKWRNASMASRAEAMSSVALGNLPAASRPLDPSALPRWRCSAGSPPSAGQRPRFPAAPTASQMPGA